ncbi:MAG: aldehyde ferredoxin oxidoreductase C-terminal domain-containing protein [Chloroflexota bacterium]
MYRVLRVDMETLSVREEALPERWRALGGRGLVDKVLLEEVDPTCEPLGPENKLIFATGIFAGHVNVSSSGRLSIGFKSPLTGGIKESNGGGTVGHKLGRLGYRLVIVEGEPTDGGHYVLKIDKDGATLLPGEAYWGGRCFDTAARLRAEHGGRVGVATIGPIGERGYLIGGVAVTDSEGGANRYCAKGGVAAVMAKRGLKALVVDDAGGADPELADKERFREAAKRFNQALMNHPITGDMYPKVGTAGLVSYVNQVGGLPTRAFRSGTFEKSDAISGERMAEVIKERGGDGKTTHACMPGCVIRSSNVFPDASGKAYCSPIEFETLGLCGSNLGLGTLDEIAEVNRWCNDWGVDTIELGAALGVAMDAGLARFDDITEVRRLLGEIEQGTILGRVLGQGCVVTGRALGVSRIPAILGQGVSAYDPRAVKGNGVTYITSPQGADHTAGNTIRLKVAHADAAGKARLARNAQINAAAVDTIGICLFAGGVIAGDQSLVRDMVAAKFGADVPEDFYPRLGAAVMRDEIAFNEAAGVPPVRARMPEFFLKEPLAPTNAVFDVPLAEIEEIVRF